ncbi:MAG TPA: S8 family serine peptidase, partial [Saprospiraceae bacterium]|nr:S8 family serine peptidase [Saprospiraceae bacterium]
MKNLTSCQYPLNSKSIILHACVLEFRKSIKVCGICVLMLFVALTQLSSQNGPDGLPLYQEGVIYVQLDPEQEQTLMPYPDSATEKTQTLYDIFDEYEVVKVEMPFSTLPSTDFDYAYRIWFEEGDTKDFIDDLEAQSIVQFAERVPCNRICLVPNDPSVQPNAPPNESSYQLDLIGAFDAFDLHTGGGAVIAVVDNAIYTGHEDLEDNVIAQYDVADDDAIARPPGGSSTVWGHGTHVAGIAAAVTHNEKGIASPGWNNDLIAIKATKSSSDPSIVDSGFDGITKAAELGADVISCSWGGYGSSEMEYKMVVDVYNMGVIIVASAGNDHALGPLYPAAYGEGLNAWEDYDRNMVIAVASIDEDKTRSYWSGMDGSNYGQWIDISSYGTNIYSTDFFDDPVPDYYNNRSGTSMAAPLVASVAGLMHSYQPTLEREDLLRCLIASANSDIYGSGINPPNNNYTMGSGRLDAYAALVCSASGCSSQLAFAPFIWSDKKAICHGEEVQLTASEGLSYLWSTSATTKSITVSTPGTYSVTVYCQNFNAVPDPYTVRDILSDLPDFVTIDNSGSQPNDGIACVGDAIVTSAYWGKEYQWSDGSITGSWFGGQANVPFSLPVSCTITDVGGCEGVDEVVETLLIWTPPAVVDILFEEDSGLPNDGTICESVEVQMTAIGGESYEWSTSETGLSIVVHPEETTTYTLTITDEYGCEQIKDVTISVTQDCLPVCSCTNGITLGTSSSSETDISGEFPSTNLYPHSCLFVRGTLIIDKEFLFYETEIRMDEGAKIIVESSNTLTLWYSSIYACTRMWKGIEVQGDANIRALSSLIKDAEYAIRIKKGAEVRIQGNRFESNYIGIYAPDEGTGSPSFENFTPIGANIFSGFGTLKQPYDGHPEYPDWPEPTEEIPTDKPYAGMLMELYGVFFNRFDGQENKFTNLRNGIIWNKFSANFVNLEFSEMLGLGTNEILSGNGIVSQGGFGVTIHECSFSDSYRGVVGIRSDINVSNNSFTDISGNFDIPGAAIYQFQQQRTTATYNSITNADIGISLELQHASNSGYKISNNPITFNTPAGSCTGIKIQNVQ